MASIPPEEPMPDTGPIEGPEPTPMPVELPPMPGDIDQPAAVEEPAENAPGQQASGYIS
jgi:hypothetical protein